MVGYRTLLTVLFTVASVSLASAKPAGQAVGVSPVALIIQGSKEDELAVGQGVFMGDKIVTTSNGQVQIEFRDKTRLVIGPNSELEITKYIAGGRSRAKAFAIKAVAGVYRFISGRSAKPNYDINTPTGTIGIRGTRFDFGVRSAGRTYVILFDGVVQLCGSAGSCRTVDELCEIAGTNSRGEARLSSESDFLPRRGDIRRSFPYVRSQSSLLDRFKVAAAPRCRDSVAPPNGIDTRGGDESGGRGNNT